MEEEGLAAAAREGAAGAAVDSEEAAAQVAGARGSLAEVAARKCFLRMRRRPRRTVGGHRGA